MIKGYVEIAVIKCLVLGAAGVGKTHLKHLLLGMVPPALRVSTGLADNPVRAISSSLVGVDGDDNWFVIEDDKVLISIIRETIKGGVSIAPSLTNVVSLLPKMAMTGPSDGASMDNPMARPEIYTNTEAIQQDRLLKNELIYDENNSPGACGKS